MSERRPLGPANLVSRPEIAAELRCAVDRVDLLVAGLRVYQVGRDRLWLWRDVLVRIASDAEVSESRSPSPTPTLKLLPRDAL